MEETLTIANRETMDGVLVAARAVIGEAFKRMLRASRNTGLIGGISTIDEKQPFANYWNRARAQAVIDQTERDLALARQAAMSMPLPPAAPNLLLTFPNVPRLRLGGVMDRHATSGRDGHWVAFGFIWPVGDLVNLPVLGHVGGTVWMDLLVSWSIRDGQLVVETEAFSGDDIVVQVLWESRNAGQLGLASPPAEGLRVAVAGLVKRASDDLEERLGVHGIALTDLNLTDDFDLRATFSWT